MYRILMSVVMGVSPVSDVVIRGYDLGDCLQAKDQLIALLSNDHDPAHLPAKLGTTEIKAHDFDGWARQNWIDIYAEREFSFDVANDQVTEAEWSRSMGNYDMGNNITA